MGDFAPQVLLQKSYKLIDLGSHEYSHLGIVLGLGYICWLLYLFFKRALEFSTSRSVLIAASAFLVCAVIATGVHRSYQENRIRYLQSGPDYLILKKQLDSNAEHVVMRYEINAIKVRSQGKQNCYLEIELTDRTKISTNPLGADRSCKDLLARISRAGKN